MAMRFLFHRRQLLLTSVTLLAGVRLDSHAEGQPFITVAATTSPEQSGLLGYLLPLFTRKTGIDVYVASIGMGQALKSGELGECDVVLVHDRSRELEFMQKGFGSVRREVMYDDFVVVGPVDDPAKVDAMHDVVAALRRIAEAKSPFVSRGDKSGTEAAEQRLWNEAGGRPKPHRDPWYLETGSSMEQTLATAESMNAYTLTDRGTWLKFNDRRDRKIVVEGDMRLMNQYAVILVNPARHPRVKAELGIAFIDWVTSSEGQDAITSYKINGEQVFFPDYIPPK
jgi:tungstate transport system substrate-binding protein